MGSILFYLMVGVLAHFCPLLALLLLFLADSNK